MTTRNRFEERERPVTDYRRHQHTISQRVTLEGVGYWSGLTATVEFREAPPESGITFVRRDLAEQPRIAIQAENGIEIPRRTSMQSGSASVEMIEHIMAALAGLQIDNCEIWIDRAEIPAFDGSSRQIVEALASLPLVDQKVEQPSLVIDREIRIADGDGWIAAVPTGRPGLQLNYQLEYEMSSIGRQELDLTVTPQSFVQELASARTFILDSEAEWLRSQGLGRQVSFRDILVFAPDGVIDNQLRFPDECVRHKALDVVGDLAVAGIDIHGKIVAHKSGHKLNGMFVKELLDEFQLKQAIRLNQTLGHNSEGRRSA